MKSIRDSRESTVEREKFSSLVSIQLGSKPPLGHFDLLLFKSQSSRVEAEEREVEKEGKVDKDGRESSEVESIDRERSSSRVQFGSA